MNSQPPALSIALVQQALGLHQKGQLKQAQALYDRALEIDPEQFDALHLSGVIARQLGEPERAINLITRAIGINPRAAAAHCNLGAALQDAGRTLDALASYQQAVLLDPQYALALSNLGNTLRKLDRLDEAMCSYERALAVRPAYPEALCNKAVLLHDLGRDVEALAYADRALALRAAYVDALCARANALQALGRHEEASASYDRAISAAPANAEAWCWRGTALQRRQAFDEALGSYDRAIALKPDYANAHLFRANTLRALRRFEEAVKAYRSALSLGGDREQIGFALASLGVGEAPVKSPASYIKTLFDNYANHFDQHLTQVLDYQMPAILNAAIARHVRGNQLDTLDLGCGTGLCGSYLRAYSRELTGVDLSQKMLHKASERGLYDHLACADIGEFLDGRAGTFDLIAAADVFVYFGDLAPVLVGAQRALRRSGLFCFSVEAADAGDYTLTSSSRFAHSLGYLQRLADQAGFTIIEAQAAPSRTEHGARVDAYVLVMQN